MLRGKQPRLFDKVLKLFISEKDMLLSRQTKGRLGSSHSFVEIVTNHCPNYKVIAYL